jgi:CRP-like cAMP-binding protein
MEITRLAALPLFAPLTFDQIGQIAPLASELRVEQGRRLLLDGPFSADLIVIETGRAQVRFAGERLAELGPGDVFGNLAAAEFPTATVSALTDMTLVTFSGRDVKRVGARAPKTGRLLRLSIDAHRPMMAAAV